MARAAQELLKRELVIENVALECLPVISHAHPTGAVDASGRPWVGGIARALNKALVRPIFARKGGVSTRLHTTSYRKGEAISKRSRCCQASETSNSGSFGRTRLEYR